MTPKVKNILLLISYYIALVAVCGALFFFASCPRSPYHEVVQGETVQGKLFEGFIINHESMKNVEGSETIGWTPEKFEVLALEADLVDFVRNHENSTLWEHWIGNHLTEYNPQYIGFFRKDRKVLGINFHHKSEPIEPTRDWREGMAGYLAGGGGYKHFTIIYDVKKKKFIDFLVITPVH